MSFEQEEKKKIEKAKKHHQLREMAFSDHSSMGLRCLG